jgi:hypothetical protein
MQSTTSIVLAVLATSRTGPRNSGPAPLLEERPRTPHPPASWRYEAVVEVGPGERPGSASVETWSTTDVMRRQLWRAPVRRTEGEATSVRGAKRTSPTASRPNATNAVRRTGSAPDPHDDVRFCQMYALGRIDRGDVWHPPQRHLRSSDRPPATHRAQAQQAARRTSQRQRVCDHCFISDRRSLKFQYEEGPFAR